MIETMLTKKQIQEFESKLDGRYNALREEIRQELLDSEDERFIDLAGQVHDLEEQSVADLLVDVDLTIVDIHMDELRAIDAALKRIAARQYGTCIDCSAEISLERLRANPTAARCRDCQERFERQHAGTRTPSL